MFAFNNLLFFLSFDKFYLITKTLFIGDGNNYGNDVVTNFKS